MRSAPRRKMMRGRPLPDGVYFMRFDAGEHQALKKVLVLR